MTAPSSVGAVAWCPPRSVTGRTARKGRSYSGYTEKKESMEGNSAWTTVACSGGGGEVEKYDTLQGCGGQGDIFCAAKL